MKLRDLAKLWILKLIMEKSNLKNKLWRYHHYVTEKRHQNNVKIFFYFGPTPVIKIMVANLNSIPSNKQGSPNFEFTKESLRLNAGDGRNKSFWSRTSNLEDRVLVLYCNSLFAMSLGESNSTRVRFFIIWVYTL